MAVAIVFGLIIVASMLLLVVQGVYFHREKRRNREEQARFDEWAKELGWMPSKGDEE